MSDPIIEQADEALQLQFRFLDALREGGSINMFGAREPLADMFDLSKKDAGNVLALWMKTFERRHPKGA